MRSRVPLGKVGAHDGEQGKDACFGADVLDGERRGLRAIGKPGRFLEEDAVDEREDEAEVGRVKLVLQSAKHPHLRQPSQRRVRAAVGGGEEGRRGYGQAVVVRVVDHVEVLEARPLAGARVDPLLTAGGEVWHAVSGADCAKIVAREVNLAEGSIGVAPRRELGRVLGPTQRTAAPLQLDGRRRRRRVADGAQGGRCRRARR